MGEQIIPEYKLHNLGLFCSYFSYFIKFANYWQGHLN